MKTIVKILIIIVIFIMLAMFLSWDDARREKLQDIDMQKNDSIKADYNYIIIKR